MNKKLIKIRPRKRKRSLALARYLRKQIMFHQSDVWVRRNRPMSSLDGIYFNEQDLEFWIKQFKLKDCVGHSEWSERYQTNIWIKDDDE